MGMVFPERNTRVASSTLWFPKIYLPSVRLIQENSHPDDIIYSDLANVGVCLASLSNRATANALLPEIGSSYKFDPFLVSKIIILPNLYNLNNLHDRVINKYKLVKIGENKIFILYNNPSTSAKINIHKASVPFWLIITISIIIIALLFFRTKLKVPSKIKAGP